MPFPGSYRKPALRKRRRYPRKTNISRTLSAKYGQGRQSSLQSSNSQFVKLRYVVNEPLWTTGTSAKVFDYRANDLYDPEVSVVTSHQPMGFDQWMALYYHFTVVGSKITVLINGVPTIPLTAVLCLRGDNTSAGTLQNWQERPDTVQCLISNDGGGRTNGKTKDLSMGFSTKRFFNAKSVVGDANYRGDIATSPTEQAFFSVLLATPSGSNCTWGATDVMTIIIDYAAVLTEWKTVSGS